MERYEFRVSADGRSVTIVDTATGNVIEKLLVNDNYVPAIA